MTSEQALKILADASAQFRGTRADHEMIGQAIATIAAAIAPPPPTPPAPEPVADPAPASPSL